MRAISAMVAASLNTGITAGAHRREPGTGATLQISSGM